MSVGIVFLLIVGAVAFSSPGKPVLAGVFFVVALVVIGWIFIKSKVRRSPRLLYALLLETTGTPQTVLASYDYADLSRLSDNIVKAIEDPPTSPQNYYINTVHGDQFTVKGHHNIGKQAG